MKFPVPPDLLGFFIEFIVIETSLLNGIADETERETVLPDKEQGEIEQDGLPAIPRLASNWDGNSIDIEPPEGRSFESLKVKV